LLSKDQEKAQALARLMRKTNEDIDQTEAAAAADFKAMSYEANNGISEVQRSAGREGEKLTKAANIALKTLVTDIKKKAAAWGEKLGAIEKKNTRTTKRTVEQTEQKLKKIEKKMEEKSQEVKQKITKAKTTVKESKEKTVTFKETQQSKLADLSNQLAQDTGTMLKTENKMKHQWDEEAEEMEDEEAEEYKALEIKTKKLSADQEAALASASDATKARLAAVGAAADMGLGKLKEKLGAVAEVEIESFDDSKEWMGELDGMVEEFGGELASWEKESDSMLGGMSQSTKRAMREQEAALAQFGGDLLSNLEAMEAKSNASVLKSEAAAEKDKNKLQEDMVLIHGE